ncbi:MAG: lysophospholipase [Bacteroidota bacterium]
MLEIFEDRLPNGIFFRTWNVAGPKAVMLAVHGMGTHSGRFSGIASGLAEAGIASVCYDHPGHGNSPGKRGHFRNYDELLDTLQLMLDRVRTDFPGLPVFFFGHSMGGNVVANFVIRRKPKVDGVVLSSPWLRLSFNPPFFKMMLARLVVNLLPGLTQESKLNINYISHDPEVLKAYDQDKLVHSYITPRFFLETVKAGLYALANPSGFGLPLYIYHGTEDHITSFAASEKFAQGVKNCRFKAWDGCYHEVHNEWVKAELMGEMVGFVELRMES